VTWNAEVRMAAGACLGAAIAAAAAPLTRAWFSVPTGGVGIVTISGYPKAYDYAAVALLIAGSAIGGYALSVGAPALGRPAAGGGRRYTRFRYSFKCWSARALSPRFSYKPARLKWASAFSGSSAMARS